MYIHPKHWLLRLAYGKKNIEEGQQINLCRLSCSIIGRLAIVLFAVYVLLTYLWAGWVLVSSKVFHNYAWESWTWVPPGSYFTQNNYAAYISDSAVIFTAFSMIFILSFTAICLINSELNLSDGRLSAKFNRWKRRSIFFLALKAIKEKCCPILIITSKVDEN
jgi:hypothetical protein